MNVTEVEIDESIRSHLPGSASEGAELVGVSCDDDPLTVVEAIQAFVYDQRAPFVLKRLRDSVSL